MNMILIMLIRIFIIIILFMSSFVLMKAVPPYESIPRYQLHHNLLPPKNPNLPSHTLVLDLDETLVHCYLEEPAEYDICFPINDGEEYFVYLCFRPYVFHFLDTMSKYFELIVYTAGIRQYASTICDLLNNEKKLIQYVCECMLMV